MKRREFLATAAALSVLPSIPARAASGTPYTPGLVDAELAAGKTVFVDFYTDWCTTCAAQQRAISALKDAKPAYEETLTFVSVDWDQHRNGDLARRLNIPRRSTLVVLKGDQELGRIVAGTSRAQIEGLLETALGAATA